MGSRWYSFAVVGLWIATMSWLIMQKVLPRLLTGDPPSYETIVKEPPQGPIGWRLCLNKQRLGWALNTVVKQPTDTTEIHGWVHFDNIPFDQLIPEFLRGVSPIGFQPFGRLEIEAENVIMLDPLNHLVSFDSWLRPKAGQSIVHISGTVEGSKVKLSVHLGDDHWELELPLGENVNVGDTLSPQMRLPGLRAGQTWTIPSYTPLAIMSNPASRNPIEILHARVEGMELAMWNGRHEYMWLVVYRTEVGDGPGSDKNVRNRLWVRRDGKGGQNGMVVREQVLVGDSTLEFTRMSDQEAQSLWKSHDESQNPKKH